MVWSGKRKPRLSVMGSAVQPTFEIRENAQDLLGLLDGPDHSDTLGDFRHVRQPMERETFRDGRVCIGVVDAWPTGGIRPRHRPVVLRQHTCRQFPDIGRPGLKGSLTILPTIATQGGAARVKQSSGDS